MFNIFDLVMLAVIIVFIVVGCLRGAIKTILSFAGGIVSLFLSAVIGKALAMAVYDAFFKQSILDKISTAVTDVIKSGTNNIGDSVVSALPEFIRNLIGDEIINNIGNMTVDPSQKIATNVATSVEQVISPLFVAMITVIIAIILFVILKVLLGILFHCADFLNNIPVVGTANKIAGGVLGAVYGVVIVFCVTVVISCFSSFFDKEGVLQKEIMDNSLCFSVVNGEGTASYLEKFYDAQNMYIGENEEFVTEGE